MLDPTKSTEKDGNRLSCLEVERSSQFSFLARKFSAAIDSTFGLRGLALACKLQLSLPKKNPKAIKSLLQ